MIISIKINFKTIEFFCENNFKKQLTHVDVHKILIISFETQKE